MWEGQLSSLVHIPWEVHVSTATNCTSPVSIQISQCLTTSLYSHLLGAIPRQQTNRIQSNTATHLDIRDRTMRLQQATQHQDPPNIPVKNALNDQQYPLVHLQPNFAQ